MGLQLSAYDKFSRLIELRSDTSSSPASFRLHELLGGIQGRIKVFRKYGKGAFFKKTSTPFNVMVLTSTLCNFRFLLQYRDKLFQNIETLDLIDGFYPEFV